MRRVFAVFLVLLGLAARGRAQECQDDDAFVDGAGAACWAYQGWGCDDTSFSGGTSTEELEAACPLSCGICSGEFRVGCAWDATFTFTG